MIATMTDGCNTMDGCRSGVQKRLEQMVPQLKDFGSCNDQHLGNAAQGCEALDDDVREVLVNIYFDLGGANGKGLKKKHEYERLAREKGRKLKALRKFGGTRFRKPTARQVIVQKMEAIISYLPHFQEKLKVFFDDREFDSLLKLEFIMAATYDLNEAINYFEKEPTRFILLMARWKRFSGPSLSSFWMGELSILWMKLRM